MMFFGKKRQIIEKMRKLSLMRGDILVLQGQNLPEIRKIAHELAKSDVLPDGVPILALKNDIHAMKLEQLPEETKITLLEKLQN